MITVVVWILLFTFVNPQTNETEVSVSELFYQSLETCKEQGKILAKSVPHTVLEPQCIEGVLFLPSKNQ